MSWTLIEHQALTSSVASVTLGSGGTIPQTYKTLKLIVSARTDRSATYIDWLRIDPNGSSTNGSTRYLQGDGSNVGSTTLGDARGPLATASTATASTFGSTEVTFPNYTSTTANKPISTDGVSENNATSSWQVLAAALWSNTSAITSITITDVNSANILSGSTFTLYGLA